MFKKILRSLSTSFVHTPASLRLAWKSSPFYSVTNALLTVVSALLPLAIAYVGKIIVDSVVQKSTSDTVKWVLIELGLMAAQALVQRSMFLLRSLLGARLGLDVNLMILEKAVTLDLPHFENPTFYDQLTKARREASSRPVAMITDILQLVQNALTLFGYFALLYSFSHWAVIALVLAALPATIAEMKFSNTAFRIRNHRSADNRRLNYMEYVLATDTHAKEVQVLGLGPLLLGRYRSLGEQFFKEDKALSKKRTLWAFLLSLLALGTFYSCYVLIATDAAKGALSLGTMSLYVVAFRQGQQAFQSCLTAIGNMYEHNLYMSNLFEYLAIVPEKKRAEAQVKTHTQTGILFDKVGFQYPGQKGWALKNISLYIPKGQSLALVGHNGAGKSTLIKLLTKLYEPTEGDIFINGKNLKEWSDEEVREHISVVFQDFNRYQLTLGENVGLGSVNHIENEERIKQALQLSGGDELLPLLAHGLKSPLGRWFMDGAELSGGQWQKVALARAFMREEADILILDEPTAALDAQAEHAVFEKFRSLTKGRTSILISHRFPTVRMADKIVVIEAGTIQEEGTHESLVKANGRYAKLFSLQAQGYL